MTGLKKVIFEFKKFKDLYFIFVWKEYQVRYRQAVLGFLWAILQPACLMILFTTVFTFIIPAKGSDQLPRAVFYYIALLPWTLFSSTINYSIPSLAGSYTMIQKIYFPKNIFTVSATAVAFIDFCIASLLLMGLLFYYQIPINIQWLVFIPMVILVVLFSFSMALMFSALNVFYKDVNLFLTFGLRLWFFCTPILYSVDQIPAKAQIILKLNPLTYLITSMRQALVGDFHFIWLEFLMVLGIILGISFISLKFFQHTEQQFADII